MTLAALCLSPSALSAATPTYATGTLVDLNTGGSSVDNTYSQSWNHVGMPTGNAGGFWPENKEVTGIQLKDVYGNDSYQLSIKKTKGAGMWNQGNKGVVIPSVPGFAEEGGINPSLIGPNNDSTIIYTLSGFQSGDSLKGLIVGGFATNNADPTKYRNTYTMTITGATLANLNQINMQTSTEDYTMQWSIVDDNTVQLTMASTDKSTAQVGFAAELSDLVMTGTDLSIQIGASSTNTSGANSGIAYIAVLPEPATCSLGLLSLGLLCLRRRRV